MRNTKVLVTGANGYLGKHVVKKLLDKGCEVIACDLNTDNIDDRAQKISLSIFDNYTNLYKELNEPDILIHLAWKDGFKHDSKIHMEMLSEHIKFLTHFLENGIHSMTVIGSMHEVGYWNGKIDENTPCKPLCNYGIAKNALREWLLLNTKNSKTKIKWLRGFYIYGDDLNGCSIFSKITKAVNEGKKTFPITTGKNKYDFISIDEISDQIVAASIQDKYNGIINVCSGIAKQLSEQIEWFIKEKNYDIKLNYGAFPDREYDSPIVYGDATIINKIMKMDDFQDEK